MANVDLISISMVDHKGDTESMVISVPTGQTKADLELLMQAVASALDDVTGALIQSATVTQQLTLPGGLKVAATVDQDIQKGANMGYDCANTPYRTTLRVPAIDPLKLVGELVDVTDAAIIAFNSQVVNGVGTAFPSDKYANDITGFIEGRVTFRK